MTGSRAPRRTLAALAAIIVTVSTSALAERVAVRSGEHAGFTRLVLDLPRAVPWTLTSAEDGERLRLSGIKAEFDLSDAFRRISTGRIAGLAPGAGDSTLDIRTGCDCRVEAFRLGTAMLVVDVHGPVAAPVSAVAAGPDPAREAPGDGPPTRVDKEHARPTQPGSPVERPSSFAFPFETGRTTPTPFPLGGRAAPGADTRVHSEQTADGSHRANPSGPAAAPAQIDRSKRISEAEQRLVEQLSRAVSQGLVVPRGQDLPAQAATVPDHQRYQDPAADPPAPDNAHREPAMPGINLRAQTSADRDFAQLIGALQQNGNGDRCIADAELDIGNWAADAPFGEQVGRLRGTLVGEFDRPDPDIARQLARTYIRFGFGAEALQVLQVSALQGQDTMLLKSMAEIMEFGHSRGPGPLSNQFECDSHAALWAVLAQPAIPAGAPVNEAAILRAVEALPPDLRGLLGPMLAERLVLDRREALAAQVLRIVERGLDKTDTHFEMAEAHVSLAEGDMHAAAESLDNVVDGNTQLSPKALVALIDTRLQAGLPVDIQTANLAGAYAQEYRKDPLGAELKRVHILALAESGAYDEAYAEFLAFSAHRTPEENRAIRSQAMIALARDAGDMPFLKYALDIHNPEAVALEPASANAVAERLIRHGFPVQADAYLDLAAADATNENDRRLLRARAAIAQGLPRRAEADLLGLAGPEADLLRAEAHAMSGEHDSAARLFTALERQDEALAQAWLGQDWDALRETGDPLWQETAELAAAPTRSLPEAPQGILARDRALIDTSEAARRTMSGLLDRLAVGASPVAME